MITLCPGILQKRLSALETLTTLPTNSLPFRNIPSTFALPSNYFTNTQANSPTQPAYLAPLNETVEAQFIASIQNNIQRLRAPEKLIP